MEFDDKGDGAEDSAFDGEGGPSRQGRVAGQVEGGACRPLGRRWGTHRRPLCLLVTMPPAPTISQELQALIKYIEINKAGDMDWFTIKPTNKEGTHWEGTCWYIHELVKYEFKFQVRGMGRAGPQMTHGPRVLGEQAAHCLWLWLSISMPVCYCQMF